MMQIIRFVLGKLDPNFMTQWQYTIFIMDLIVASVKTVFLSVQTGEGNITMITFIIFCLALLIIGNEYLELYVDLSKI